MAFEEQNLDGGQTSKFNAGILQMKRIHDIQERINTSNLNLLAYNEMYGLYNYKLKIASLNALFQEVAPKLSTTEKEEGINMRNAVGKYLDKLPIHQTQSRITGYQKSVVIVNQVNWKVHEGQLNKYEEMIRRFLDAHKLNSPPEDEVSFL